MTSESGGKVKQAILRPIRHGLTLLYVPVALLILWSIISYISESTLVVGPIEALHQIETSLTSKRYIESLVSTLYTLVAAFVTAVIVGGAFGFLLGLYPFWRRVLSPIAHGVYSIPLVTVFPIFLVFFGLGLTSRTAFAFMHGVIPMMIVVMEATNALRSSDIYLKLGASLEMSFPQLVFKIILPGIFPAFLTASRLTFGLVFLGTILAEMFTANGGLGHELIRNMYLVKIDRILAQIVLIGLLALIPNGLLRVLEVRTANKSSHTV